MYGIIAMQLLTRRSVSGTENLKLQIARDWLVVHGRRLPPTTFGYNRSECACVARLSVSVCRVQPWLVIAYHIIDYHSLGWHDGISGVVGCQLLGFGQVGANPSLEELGRRRW